MGATPLKGEPCLSAVPLGQPNIDEQLGDACAAVYGARSHERSVRWVGFIVGAGRTAGSRLALGLRPNLGVGQCLGNDRVSSLRLKAEHLLHALQEGAQLQGREGELRFQPRGRVFEIPPQCVLDQCIGEAQTLDG